ncbi:hypothetical protein [Chryseobacterium sp. MP_3.2]|uniref:hypothetical protein n=1 Tax=Chryseobacterium sp. MP_3.2 TaxID=3071712 RepID=UPI002E011C24|nr:hypothetical protein [Chryseobacterium sp. MP_3.2]
MKNTQEIPVKLNISGMIHRLQMKSENDKILSLRYFFHLKEKGVIPVTDLIKIIKGIPIHEIFLKMHIVTIKTEDGLFSYGQLLSLLAKCELIKITHDLRFMVNDHLEYIYKNLK